MTLARRLQLLESKLETKKPGCNPTVFIVIPQERPPGRFDTSSYRPSDDEVGKYLKHLKDGGQCRDCKGSCAIDWAPDGFKNHTLTGECSSSSPDPSIFWMYCAEAETPVLMRKVVNREGTQPHQEHSMISI